MEVFIFQCFQFAFPWWPMKLSFSLCIGLLNILFYKVFMFSFYFYLYFFGAGSWTQGLVHVKHTLLSYTPGPKYVFRWFKVRSLLLVGIFCSHSLYIQDINPLGSYVFYTSSVCYSGIFTQWHLDEHKRKPMFSSCIQLLQLQMSLSDAGKCVCAEFTAMLDVCSLIILVIFDRIWFSPPTGLLELVLRLWVPYCLMECRDMKGSPCSLDTQNLGANRISFLPPFTTHIIAPRNSHASHTSMPF